MSDRGAKTIKSVSFKNYEVSLYELPSGSYIIGVESQFGPSLSESINDFKTATFLFDLKIRELEGH